MDWEKWCLRLGAGAVVFALAVRLFCGGAAEAVVEVFAQPEVASALLFLETGRLLRPAPESATQAQKEPVSTDNLAIFSAQDEALVSVNPVCGYDTDVTAWLETPLSWQLQQDKPTVLIVHSHGTESYENTENYNEYTAYRTRDTNYNVVSVGAEIKKALEAGGISVLHDTTCHDDPSYTAAYTNSRKSIKSYLEQYPSIEIVLDIHRDSVENKDGNQVRYTVETPEGTSAKLMLVVGTDANGLAHPNWPENMAFAVKLHALLEKTTPGLCRPISFRKQRFNQDLSPGALIVEVGSAGNTRQEALLAGQLLAEAILQLSNGAKT
ncbi:MAG: stage II sporulation protein P [Oscillospiraceae bacterium]|nr:stage II sporulation protein P [Oscillospiraceae bacterium]